MNIDDIETRATTAAEEWDVFATRFFDSDDVTKIYSHFSNLGGLGMKQISGGGRGSFSRARFVFTNPDLLENLDEQEFCTVLCVENSDACVWPNMLDSIGVKIGNVGDVLVFDKENIVYLTVTPDVAKVCTRLLPKELKGAGVTVSVLTEGESIPDGGELQEMEMQRLDKRTQK
eukprot:CAMPEP_0113320094 /NCGR_PEP_ID=MMETSP0010_2-20120614/14028_1 /TAXON_ID=216773 ORGANISM="Corethron hystrix, Strain 308" /NCGR_SAMPLE_ID=MMETSP0010_2 /ASSEMBLY_ACC=CAM_ASM_000155 /LENGTH=173 /DNA_ID=CAMNT_0000177783 /DNA_START=208 /DNA_END=726 /DNA_ORIENTATION=+ /assembly_acc=CAM_ASM_000155